MKKLISFFEIPASDFNRAVKFYETILATKMTSYDCEQEKMAFFPEEDGDCPGAISWAERFKPSLDGVMISLTCNDITETLRLIEENGGKTLIAKTKIQADNMGFFAIFVDSEGNRVGLYSDN